MAVKRLVLVLNHFALPRHAPGGTRHVDLFERLRNWEARIIASNRNYFTGRWTQSQGPTFTTVWTFPPAGKQPARVLSWISYFITALFASLRAPRPEVVYASSPHLLAGLAGYVVARVRRTPLILEVRDLWPRVLVEMGVLQETSRLYRALLCLESFLYRKADAIVVLTRGVKEVLAAKGIPRGRIWLLPNGADPEDFSPPAPKEELRKRYGFDGVVFAYTGAHGPANALELLLDAAAELVDELPEVRFVLVGDGPSKQALVERAHRQAQGNVRFLAPVPKNEMPALLGAVDVGVHVLAPVPLFSYGVSPNKIFDYMAAGLPVLTNVGGEVGETVERAAAGIAVPATKLAEGIRAMSGAGIQRRQQWGACGRDFVVRHHSRLASSAHLEKLLEETVGARERCSRS